MTYRIVLVLVHSVPKRDEGKEGGMEHGGVSGAAIAVSKLR
jgi:hypothetical protein